MRKLPRVWDKVTKEMMLPARWEEDYVGCGHKKIGLYIYRSRKNMIDHSSLDWVLRHPEYFDVMWPTGIKDKNNKKIYEHDIFKAADGWTGTVAMVNGMWVIGNKDGVVELHWDADGGEVIGNIHEDPELLEK